MPLNVINTENPALLAPRLFGHSTIKPRFHCDTSTSASTRIIFLYDCTCICACASDSVMVKMEVLLAFVLATVLVTVLVLLEKTRLYRQLLKWVPMDTISNH